MSTKSLLNPDDYKTTTWDYDNDTNTIPNENPTRNVYRKIDSGYTMDVNQQIVSYEFITRQSNGDRPRLIPLFYRSTRLSRADSPT